MWVQSGIAMWFLILSFWDLNLQCNIFKTKNEFKCYSCHGASIWIESFQSYVAHFVMFMNIYKLISWIFQVSRNCRCSSTKECWRWKDIVKIFFHEINNWIKWTFSNYCEHVFTTFFRFGKLLLWCNLWRREEGQSWSIKSLKYYGIASYVPCL